MIRLLFLLLTCFPFWASGQSLEDQIDQFYHEFIVEQQVNYTRLSQSNIKLDQLLQEIKSVEWQKLTPSGQQAFLLNAYNLYVIKAVINSYPVVSPKAINGFFTQKKYKLANKSYSLDQIEKDLLFGIKRDPRFHLVLICGANSCPPFFPKAFRTDSLENQLEEASRIAINSNWLQVKKDELLVSEIFGWYSHDFGDIPIFINKYLKEKTADSKPVKFTKYDWGLNEYLASGNTQQPFVTASQLMPVGTWEIKAFQATYTQVDRNGFDRDNSRSTYFSSFNQFLAGVTPGLNVGLDIVWKRNNINDLAQDSWIKVFSDPLGQSFTTIPCTDSEGNFIADSPCNLLPKAEADVLRNATGDTLFQQTSQGLAHLGPKVKFRPTKKIPRLTTQQTFYIPIVKSVDGQWISFTQFFYEQRLGAKGSLFTELSFWIPFQPDFRFNTFAKTFWSYFPNRKFSLYAMLAFPGEYGVGLKINLTRRLELELLTTRFMAVERFFGDRRASTFNLGLRLHQ